MPPRCRRATASSCAGPDVEKGKGFIESGRLPRALIRPSYLRVGVWLIAGVVMAGGLALFAIGLLGALWGLITGFKGIDSSDLEPDSLVMAERRIAAGGLLILLPLPVFLFDQLRPWTARTVAFCISVATTFVAVVTGLFGLYGLSLATSEDINHYARLLDRNRVLRDKVWQESFSYSNLSPETVIRQLRDGQQRIGYDLFCTNHEVGNMPPELVRNSIEIFGHEVIPAFSEG